jgi:hypothetical protein
MSIVKTRVSITFFVIDTPLLYSTIMLQFYILTFLVSYHAYKLKCSRLRTTFTVRTQGCLNQCNAHIFQLCLAGKITGNPQLSTTLYTTHVGFFANDQGQPRKPVSLWL